MSSTKYELDKIEFRSTKKLYYIRFEQKVADIPYPPIINISKQEVWACLVDNYSIRCKVLLPESITLITFDVSLTGIRCDIYLTESFESVISLQDDITHTLDLLFKESSGIFKYMYSVASTQNSSYMRDADAYDRFEYAHRITLSIDPLTQNKSKEFIPVETISSVLTAFLKYFDKKFHFEKTGLRKLIFSLTQEGRTMLAQEPQKVHSLWRGFFKRSFKEAEKAEMAKPKYYPLNCGDLGQMMEKDYIAADESIVDKIEYKR